MSVASSPSGERGGPATACASCRGKHLKCDGTEGMHTCSRCASQGVRCNYLKSRRGYRGIGGSRKQLGLAYSETNGENGFDMNCRDLEISNVSNMASVQDSMPYNSSFSLPSEVVSRDCVATGPGGPESGAPHTDYRRQCMEAFFHYFYGAHPFLPPRHQLLEILKLNAIVDLENAICYVGARYVARTSRTSFSTDFDSFLSRQDLTKEASTVQALLLYALGLDGNNEQKKSVEVLIKAQNLALELGMNQHEYALLHGRGSPFYEESLRRTWWELYTVSVMMAGLHGKNTLPLNGTIVTVPLPCEEKEFASGCIPPFRTVEEIGNNCFAEDDTEYSSYAYRIAAVRNLERVLQSNEVIFLDDPLIFRLDAYLINWNLSLPESKTAHFNNSGEFDEMIFQAHMVNNLSSLLLHRHFSKLEDPMVQNITSCTGQNMQMGMSSSTKRFHTSKTIQAASNISKLVTDPTPLIRHTHFFICALALSSIVHLSLWSSLSVMDYDQDLKQEIRMNTGALRAMARAWPSARMVFDQVNIAARKIYSNRKEAAGDVFWRDFFEEDIMAVAINNIETVDS